MYPLKQSTAITVPIFAHDANGDAVTGKVTGDWTKRISKNGGAFAAMTVTITEMENGWYSLPLDAGHTDTNGILTVVLQATGVKQINLQWRVSIAGDGANLTHIDGFATTGNNATLKLKQLHIVNNGGDAIYAAANGANGNGLYCAGQGAGHAAKLESGISGDGLNINGSTTGIRVLSSSVGVYVTTGGNGSGIVATGSGSGAGLAVGGGVTGNGATFQGGATSGDGLRATAAAGKALGDAAVDAILDRAIAEPLARDAWPLSLRKITQWLAAVSLNKQQTTATTITYRNDADSGTIATAPFSDDGTTATRGKVV